MIQIWQYISEPIKIYLMSIYKYVKTKNNKTKKITFSISLIFIFTGIAIIIWTIFPILSFELLYAPKFGHLIEPIPNNLIKKAISSDAQQILGISVDYTKASSWFPKAQNIRLSLINSSYTLTIPKLNILDAEVLVGHEDLAKSLIHFIGPLPGEYGNPVIFGHSTLPFLYDPKDYKTIFSKLPDLENYDEIFLSSDSIIYKYQVFDMKVINPNDLSVLEQQYDDRYLTLITCVPPGTYLKRLVVRCRIADL
ncbi:hypothetical protein A2Y99_03380 [Candidatus Gottesmanbacteria bacterium RBG_13_37_7]|uniref:Sortase n=1 Tax=Candidatus Gottesmanbacteria bacterium RBG_13_37_7 TaxID=1798369 RepID=A0A1F5YJT9_9BACT|nr:MAG: hypothetical protein A2Y99_03380 [Candidatus Gottesmanbacteria bacterium RBG_13_37_7]